MGRALFLRYGPPLWCQVSAPSFLTNSLLQSRLFIRRTISFWLPPLPSKCMAVLLQILHLFAELNITIAPQKTFPVYTCLEFMGILLHSNKMEAHLPVDKLTRHRAVLGQWANRKSATLQELQSLIGTLQFAPSCNALSISQRVLSSLIGTLASILVSVRTFLCGNIFSKIGAGCLSF